MSANDFTNNPYLLLTPGPLTTTDGVRMAMMKDWCTWDQDYNNIVQGVRENLVKFASKNTDKYSAVLMQGSGTFVVESVVGTTIPKDGKLFVIANGAYGYRIGQIAERLNIDTIIHDGGEVGAPDLEKIDGTLCCHSLGQQSLATACGA